MHVKPMEKGWKPHVEMSTTCPRCGSANTKFCYYNNYSLTQPRFFCKGCRRYWTKGGSLRNVPVGGGCRKSRRGKPFSDVISIPHPRGVSGGARPDVVALGSSAVTTPILSPSTNGSSLASPDQGSNIDLALVYANFLNPKPRSNEPVEAENCSPPIEIPMLPNFNAVVAGTPAFQFPTPLLSQENGFVDQCRPLSFQSTETLFTNAFFLSELDPIEKQTDYHYHHHQFISSMDNRTNINYGLPPLPGEELNTVVSEGLFWPGINDFIFPTQTLHAASSELSGIEEPPQVAEAEAPAPKRLRTENGNQLNLPIELYDLFRL